MYFFFLGGGVLTQKTYLLSETQTCHWICFVSSVEVRVAEWFRCLLAFRVDSYQFSWSLVMWDVSMTESLVNQMWGDEIIVFNFSEVSWECSKQSCLLVSVVSCFLHGLFVEVEVYICIIFGVI